jgi:hypothetical protein
MLRWLKRLFRPPLGEGEPYLTNPTPESLYLLMRKRCPRCGLSPPDWLEGEKEEDAVCVRCSVIYIVPPGEKVAYYTDRRRWSTP